MIIARWTKVEDEWGAYCPAGREGETVAVVSRDGRRTERVLATQVRPGVWTLRVVDGEWYHCDECGENVEVGDGSRCWETGMPH